MERLPSDVLHKIVRLDAAPRTIAALSLVCRAWRDALRAQQLWRTLLLEAAAVTDAEEEHVSCYHDEDSTFKYACVKGVLHPLVATALASTEPINWRECFIEWYKERVLHGWIEKVR